MRKKLWMLAVILICGTMTMLTSCSVSDNPVDNTQTDKKQARITDTIRNEKKKATIYNIEYPSTDPFGQPITMSGSILIPENIWKGEAASEGIILYNHYTIFNRIAAR